MQMTNEELVMECHKLRLRLAEVEADFATAQHDAFVLSAAHAHKVDPVQLAQMQGTQQAQIEANAKYLSQTGSGDNEVICQIFNVTDPRGYQL